jgi:hypothetical protein
MSTRPRFVIDHLGLPPLAGIATYEEACRPGLSVEDNTALLRRYNYIKSRLVEIVSAHITSTPEWEIKAGLSLHLWLDAEHAAMIRRRVGEMREPPLHLDQVPDERLKAWLDELLRSQNSLELATGIYRVAKSQLVRAMERHLERTNPLADHPTVRLLRLILQEEREMLAWGEAVVRALATTDEARLAARSWEDHLHDYLGRAGGISGDAPPTAADPSRAPRSDGKEYAMQLAPQRDARFHDSFNTSEPAHQVYQDETKSPDERMFALIYKRLREMGVPEYLSAVMYRTRGKPWDYYVDLARQVWDEARHALMGETALHAHGVAFYQFPVNIHISTALNRLDPLDVHTILWGVEQGLMPKNTGKHFEWKIAQAYGDPLCVTLQDYDWADEVLHAQIGRRWLQPEFPSREGMEEHRRQAEARWNEEMAKLRPLSQHEPWWDDFVRELRARRNEDRHSAPAAMK